MTSIPLYSGAALILFGIGLFGLAVHPYLIRKIMAVNVMAGGVFLFLISLAYAPAGQDPDPVPQAMVLTGIVVAISATAFALFLARQIEEKSTGRDQKDQADHVD